MLSLDEELHVCRCQLIPEGPVAREIPETSVLLVSSSIMFMSAVRVTFRKNGKKNELRTSKCTTLTEFNGYAGYIM